MDTSKKDEIDSMDVRLENDYLISVELLTNRHEYVTDAIIPNFLPGQKPDVLVWEDRVFLYENDRQYREGFAIAVVKTEAKVIKG